MASDVTILPIFRRLLMLSFAGVLCLWSIRQGDLIGAALGGWLMMATWWYSALSGFGPASSLQTALSSRAISGQEQSNIGEQEVIEAVRNLSRTSDPLLRRIVARKLADAGREFKSLASGKVLFLDTEGWRFAYAQLLLSDDIGEYRSVAWIRSKDYWQHPPGEHSIQTNYEALDRGVRIERICIIGEQLWPPASRLPTPVVWQWLNDQHYRGIALSLVREADLESEPDLLGDFGIYGERAGGEHIFDAASNTLQFTLSFDPPSVQLALERWERLQLFAKNLGDLVDRAQSSL